MAEREDANPLFNPYPQSYNLKRQRDPRPTWMQGAFSTLRRVMGTRVSQKSDPELGPYDAPARPSALPSRHNFAEFLDSDETFMVYRRFSWLHFRVLLHAQEKILHYQQYLEELDGKARQRDESTSHESRGWLSKTIEEKLSDYNSLIMRMHPSAQISRPSACRYQSVREYLNHGPPIYMNHSKIRFNHWASYESVVGDLLKDPETASWLDGPLDQTWSEKLLQQKHCSDHDWRGFDDLSWNYGSKRTLDHMAGILLWISHITSALGFVLISNASGPEGHPLSEILLAYWYFSAVSIVVQGFFAKGFPYARKVFLGGVVGCLVGFYILNSFMSIPTASSFTAMPTIFTVVLLLIRTM